MSESQLDMLVTNKLQDNVRVQSKQYPIVYDGWLQ